jgi:dethiobiotin synthetase
MNVFITGIGTDVGKTIVSAIVVEALQSDYWKPIQAGNLGWTDTQTVTSLVSNKKTVFHPEAFRLNNPMSPHAAAELEQVEIKLDDIKRPKTINRLVVEGAGGLLVPFNNQNTVIDLIRPEDFVLVVSKHYLGSINHTLMTVAILMSGVNIIGRVGDEEEINSTIVSKYAKQLKPILKKLIPEPSK